MNKFRGVMIASDFDNTICYTSYSMINGTPLPPISPRNREAIEYFMGEGGTFCVATGRALPAFRAVMEMVKIPTNGPSILFNGAAIYDFARQEYVYTAFLPAEIRRCIAEVFARFPNATLEIYHDDNSIHVIHPSPLAYRRMHLTHTALEALPDLDAAPLPFSKLLFESEDPEEVKAISEFVFSQPWSKEFSIVNSAAFFLEITAKGANKGDMVGRLAEILHIAPEHLYCIGDHANDVSMLERAHIPFAPSNAIECVHQVPGVHILPHCEEDAIAAMIGELDQMY